MGLGESPVFRAKGLQVKCFHLIEIPVNLGARSGRGYGVSGSTFSASRAGGHLSKSRY